MEPGAVQQTVFTLFALLFGATIHEYAHGRVADWCGDDTARQAGRLTINPLPHIDPFGSIILPLICVFLLKGGFFFAYAKPVPVNPLNFRHPRRGMLWTALAGVIANLLIAIAAAILLRLTALGVELLPLPPAVARFAGLFYMLCYFTVAINLMLFFFNLIPVPPLDGSRVVSTLLPLETALKFERIAPFGLLILLLLINTPPFQFVYHLFIGGALTLLTGAN